ncbi:MAG: hypothetical protein R3313_05245, partial [Candidatus Saccharimonadales bacterium]|nr:hypothetical protein [Candidatus Saccharimonadales bacterium]
MNLKFPHPRIDEGWLLTRGRKPLKGIFENVLGAVLLTAASCSLALMANWSWPAGIQPLVTPSLVMASALAGWQGILGYGSDAIELFSDR